MAAELPVLLFLEADIAGIDAIFIERLGAGRMIGQECVAVIVKIADDRHLDVHLQTVSYTHLDVYKRQSQNFIMSDGHDGPMPMDFYIWVIRGQGRTIVVDTGFSAGASERRNRRFVHRPAEALAQAGVDPAAVHDVVITHLHWDHSGNMDPVSYTHLR